MDVRKWLNAAIENSTYDGYVNQLALRNELEPTITKLMDALTRLQKEAGALIVAHEIALRQDSGNTNIACVQLRIDEARTALAELEKP